MRIVLLTALVAAPIFAQHRGGSPPPPAGRSHPAPPPVSRPYYPHNPRTVVVPYPVFYGGGYYSGYAPGPLSYDYGYAPPAPAPAPAAVVNPDFQPDSGNPTIVDYSNAPLPEAVPQSGDDAQLKDDQPTVFLIALTDHTVVAAIAYWVDGDTLNWVSREAKQNRMSLSLVDREFSKKLNDERHVEFKLPAAK
jgi:hypothetical protein